MEYPGMVVRSFKVRREVRSERQMFPGNRRCGFPDTGGENQRGYGEGM
jgi:hypothetical protein